MLRQFPPGLFESCDNIETLDWEYCPIIDLGKDLYLEELANEEKIIHEIAFHRLTGPLLDKLASEKENAKNTKTLGFVGVLFYYYPYFHLENEMIWYAGRTYSTKFWGGLSRISQNVAAAAAVGNSFSRSDKYDATKNTTLTGTHEIAHLFGLDHNTPHSGQCILTFDADAFCDTCYSHLEKLA